MIPALVLLVLAQPYDRIQNDGTALIRRPTVDFVSDGGTTCIDVPALNKTRCPRGGAVGGVAAVGACGANQYETADTGAGPTCVQPNFNQLAGTATDAQLASNYSGIGACGAGQFVSTLNDNAAPTCTTPAGAAHNILSASHSDTTGAGVEAAGDILYRNGSSQWARLPAGTSTQVLHGGTTPSWSAVVLTADVSGVLSTVNGGTGVFASPTFPTKRTNPLLPTCNPVRRTNCR